MWLIQNGVLFVLLTFALGAQLPSYMKKCSWSDPELNKCIATNANLAMPYVAKGDRPYKIPVLDPLTVNEIITEPGPSLKVTMRNVSVYGLEHTKVATAKLDKDTYTLDLVNEIPSMVILADYKMAGRILILPIEGQGRCNVTIMGGKYYYNLKFDLKKNKKNGKRYFFVVKDKMTYDTERMYYNFENLFNGDKRLGPQMNAFMNENWKDLQKDLGGGIGETMATVTTSILNAIFSTVSFDDMWDP